MPDVQIRRYRKMLPMPRPINAEADAPAKRAMISLRVDAFHYAPARIRRRAAMPDMIALPPAAMSVAVPWQRSRCRVAALVFTLMPPRVRHAADAACRDDDARVATYQPMRFSKMPQPRRAHASRAVPPQPYDAAC